MQKQMYIHRTKIKADVVVFKFVGFGVTKPRYDMESHKRMQCQYRNCEESEPRHQLFSSLKYYRLLRDEPTMY